LFVALTVLGFASNDWHEDLQPPTSPFGPDTTYIQNIDGALVHDYWKYINWAVEYGKHSPRLQPNITVALAYLFKVLMGDEGLHYLTHVRSIYAGKDTIHDDDRLSAFYEFITLIICMTNRIDQLELHYDEYQVGGKFRDGGSFIDGYGDYRLDQTFIESGAEVIPYDPNEPDVRFAGFGSLIIQDTFTRAMSEVSIAADDEWENDDTPGLVTGEISQVIEADYQLYPMVPFENSRVYLQGHDDEFGFTIP
jgi:hypothetical protein